MKAKKFITKAYNGELGLTMCQDWKSIFEKEFPELVKKEEVFKDGDIIRHRSKTNMIIKISDFYSAQAVGFNPSGEWVDMESIPSWSFKRSPTYWKKASPEEWKERLIEECKKRGIWDTPNINAIGETLSNIGKWQEVYLVFDDILWSKYGVVYQEGVFATPIKTISLSEAEKQLGVKIDVTK